MKKNISSNVARVLRLENLESRQMLSVAPSELAVVAQADSAIVAYSELTDDIIDVGDVATSTAVTVSEYDDATRMATISWEADETAASYSVQLSRNGGEIWVEYAQGLTETSASVANVFVGRSYAFRVVALDGEGAITTSYDELAFTPFNMTVSNSAFMFGETITVELDAADGADVNLVWNYVVDGENVVIEEAQGLLEYTPRQANDVVIVATGVNASAGCNVEATVSYVKEHASVVVTTLDDVVNPNDGVVSLREAVAFYANDGDTITFDEALANGTIALAGGQIDVVKSVTIDASAVGSITLDAGGASRIFQTSADSVTLDSLTLLNGYSQTVGGALYASEGSTLVLHNARVVDSVADYHGGGVYIDEGLDVSMVNVELTGNTSTIYGSAICTYGANLELHSVTIADNASSDSQGALFFNNNVNANVYNSIVAKNVGGDVVVGNTSISTVNGYRVLSSYDGWSNEDGANFYYDADASLFADAENGDYSLSPDSQAMDVGANNDVIDVDDLAGNARIQNGVVDLGAYEYSGTSLSFNYDASTSQATLTWLPINNASGYRLKISRDGGETWITYLRDVDDVAATAKGLYVGQSYAFRAYAVDANGASTAQYREGTFAPFSLASENGVFELGDTLAVTVKGAENANASVQWYYVADSGDVAIEGANSFEYTPTSDLYDLRVVATGVEDSLGASASLLFGRRSSKLDVVYDSATRVADLAWEPFDGVASYKVRVSRDGGTTWIDYVNGVEGLTVSVDGLWAGQEYGFRVYGETETGRTLAYRETTFTPINLVSETEVFTVGETISVAFRGADSATAEINWYFVTEDGDVEIPEAAGQLEYTPASDAYDIKVVATGTGTSQGAVVSLVFAAPWEGIAFTHNAQTNQATLTWLPIDDASGYRLRISRDGGETWITYIRDVDDVVATAKGLYVGQSYAFRAYAVDANGASTAQYFESTFAPMSIACYNAFQVGDTVSIKFRGAPNADADIRWYAMTPEGDVEILGARGLLEYAPTVDLYNLKVVATGRGASAGSNSETIVYRAADAPTFFDYNAETQIAQLSWLPIEGAVTYKLQLSRDGGETWLQYAKDLTSPTTLVDGLNVSPTNVYRVVGFEESGAKLATTYEFSYSPTSSSEALLDEAFADYFAEEF